MVFKCEPCKYTTEIKSNYLRHLVTTKHTRNVSVADSISKEYPCNTCSKMYFSRVGLWRHSKNCYGNTEQLINCNIGNITDIKDKIINEQQVQINQMMELLATAIDKINSSSQSNITNNNGNNNINTTNNINVFLQQRKETAVDWMDFVDSLDVPMEITESSEEKYASAIIYNLNTLSPEEYPIYCRDKSVKNL